MNIFMWLLFGAVAGWGSSKVMGDGKRKLSFNIIIGIVGALVGGFIAEALGIGSVTGFNLSSILIAIIGACLLEIVVRILSKKTR